MEKSLPDVVGVKTLASARQTSKMSSASHSGDTVVVRRKTSCAQRAFDDRHLMKSEYDQLGNKKLLVDMTSLFILFHFPMLRTTVFFKVFVLKL